jgi:predicted transposase/invertase (TIGR01784 family)
LKNLPDLEHIPAIMMEKVFKKAFHTAELASMPVKDRELYEHNLHDYWTYLSTLQQAKKKGRVQGRAEGIVKGIAQGKAEEKIEIARNMKKEGFEMAMIIKMTGLSPDEIERME